MTNPEGSVTRKSRSRCFGGFQDTYEHVSSTLGTTMRRGVYLPPAADEYAHPVVYWLSGLTCSEQNFITKAGAQRAAAALGLILVAPDTSPRGPQVADDPSLDLGQGAGFYVNATQAPWAEHFRMYDYIVNELPELMRESFRVTDERSILGHSMGGHGALVCALRNPGLYQSVSAFSPIVNPSHAPWGRKAFAAYLGADERHWSAYDACALVRTATDRLPILIDQGTEDEFLQTQLMPERLEAACQLAGYPLTLRRQPGYDHSYYFIASFIEDHLRFHAEAIERRR